MKYLSTRGRTTPVSFKEAVMMGLATDGGLLLPEEIPVIDEPALRMWKKLNYQQLAFEVISLFATDIPLNDLKNLIDQSYRNFSHPEVAPVIEAGDVHILELFHGPTLAFKDIALQFLGNLFEYQLKESGNRMNILGATSGDTGSAAIYGVRGKESINIFILHPHKKVSRIQELQMTTVTDPNVFNIAVRGTFDDGQAIVKSIFNDIEFKEKHNLGAVNSINWARIVAQVVYYIYSALKITGQTGFPRVDFSVPTGNFGDIFAGYIARRMLPDTIRNLILATNENDLLARFVNSGDYSAGQVVATNSPSMDIQVASNFERYLYYLNNEDQQQTRLCMEEFAESGKLAFDEVKLARIQSDFLARRVEESETLATIKDFFDHGYLLDPHTAVGVCAAREFAGDLPMICLATAHPAKFGDAVTRACGVPPELPSALADLDKKESRCEVIDPGADQVKEFINEHAW